MNMPGFLFAAVSGKSVNITKTGIDLYNSTGKLTYSAKDDVNISSSRIKIDYTVPYRGKTLMTAELYVVADGRKICAIALCLYDPHS